MAQDFYRDTVGRLLADGWLRTDDEVLVVAGGELDRDVLAGAGLRRVTITNLDDAAPLDLRPFAWAREDAEDLGYADGSFDVCLVHQGLHHCRSPHRALVEMYRVARRGIVAFEPHDTVVTRIGVRLGIGQRYERAAVADHALHSGGVRNTDVPNFVYRWTTREVEKTLASFDPRGTPRVRYFFDVREPSAAAAAVRSRPARLLARAAVPIARIALRVAPRQANALAVVADKLDPAQDLHPWLAEHDGHVAVDPLVLRAIGEESPA
jgi:SAM-dependent methyltransferase